MLAASRAEFALACRSVAVVLIDTESPRVVADAFGEDPDVAAVVDGVAPAASGTE
jgi:hypothetical protein